MVTPQMIKELRERTGVGMSDCKNALVEANGDMDMAIELLRKKWLAKAAKRAWNDTNEGKIKIVLDWHHAYIAVVSCETDFVARNDTFEEMLTRFIDIRKVSSDDTSALIKAEELKASEYTLKVWENIQIRVLTLIEWPVIASYVHSNYKNAAVVVGKAGTDPDKLRNVAMHVVASAPQVVSPSDISDDIISKERDIQLSIMQQDAKNVSKPSEILEKIIEGKMMKFREENALMTQPFVMNPDQKVSEFIWDWNVIQFYNFTI